MPDDRFIHPRITRDQRITRLSDAAFRVLILTRLGADDYGVLRQDPLAIQALDDSLAARPRRVIQQALDGLVAQGLLLAFEHGGRAYICHADWQDEQKIRYPRATLNPCPPAAVLTCCSADTQTLFAKHPNASPEHSRNVSEVVQEHSSVTSDTLLRLPRAGARETANGKRLPTNGDRPPANGNRQQARRALEESFVAFWARYPKKRNRKTALAAWLKLKPPPEVCARINAALDWQVTQDDWLREGGRYVPQPANWLDGAGWEDERTQTPHVNDGTLALARAGEGWMKS